MRKCTQCGVIATNEKELVKFVKQARGKHGYRNLCKECHSASESYGSRYDADYYYDKSLKSLYNINIEDYNNMFKEQQGCCKICDTHQSKLKRRLYVDHCHTTNKVRGLLCQSCNTFIGFSYDSPKRLKRAIEYISNT